MSNGECCVCGGAAHRMTSTALCRKCANALDREYARERARMSGVECIDSQCPGWRVVYATGDLAGLEIEACDQCQRFADDDMARTHALGLMTTRVMERSFEDAN